MTIDPAALVHPGPWPAYEPTTELDVIEPPPQTPDTQLSRDQEIRARAAQIAAGPYVGVDPTGCDVGILAEQIVGLAATIEAYIRGGEAR